MDNAERINHRAIEEFEKVFDSKGHFPKRWLYYCKKQMKFYLGKIKEIYREPEDIVDEVIFRTIDGSRKWNPEEVPLEAHIKMCIKSILSHMAESWERNQTDDIIINKKTGEKADALENAHEHSKQDLEKLFSNNDLVERCRIELDDDTEMGIIFESMLEGKTPKEMEKEYGVTPEQVDAVKKRIKRFLNKIFDPDDYLDM